MRFRPELHDVPPHSLVSWGGDTFPILYPTAGHLYGNHEHGALWLLICNALEKHLLTCLLTYLLTYLLIMRLRSVCPSFELRQKLAKGWKQKRTMGCGSGIRWWGLVGVWEEGKRGTQNVIFGGICSLFEGYSPGGATVLLCLVTSSVDTWVGVSEVVNYLNRITH